jgi:hypothetical protein
MKHRREASGRSGTSALSVLLGVLGAALYVASVYFALGDRGNVSPSDLVAERVMIGFAGLLCFIAFVLGVAGLRAPHRRGRALLGIFLGGAFLGFIGLSLLRAF